MNFTQQIYKTAIVAVSIFICLTGIALWRVLFPIDHGQIERWQQVQAPVKQVDGIQAKLAEPTPPTGVAGVSVSRDSIGGSVESVDLSMTPTPIPNERPQVTSVPVVVQPIACALGPTPLPQGGPFCQFQK